MAAAATQAKDDGVMSRGGGNGNGETQAGQEILRNYNIKGMKVYHGRGRKE